MTHLLPSLADIEAAATVVYRDFPPTPQYRWGLLSERLGTECWLKHENHTPVGAFKIRGGLTYFDQLARRGPLPREVISATRGNHGQSMGWAARRHGVACTIVVPRGNSLEKNAAMRALGVTLVEHGDDFQEAREHALHLAQERGAHMVPSFHPDLLRGVATYWWEFLRAVPQLDVVYVPIGQGSGACSAIAAKRALGHGVRIVGVVSRHATTYADSIAAGRVIEAPVTTQLADGMACRVADQAALDILIPH
ncbi:MAG TPA: threonine dehydratase, partial [Giesbergeria sp.]|nr:threonine dehydratase [Giesbergeria sp.]